MSNKKRITMIIIIISIIIIIIASIGIAYGVSIIYKREGTTNNKLIVGDIYMRYKEGSAINLSGAMPSNNYPSAATNNYFEFIITGKNTHPTRDITYTLKLAHGDIPNGKSSSNRIADTWLYFKLVEVNNNVETPLVTDAHYTTIPNSTIYIATIPHNTSSVLTKTYRLYARIDNNLVIGNTSGANYSIEAWNNLFASVKINAEGEDVETTEITFNANGGTVSPTSKRIPITQTIYGELPEPTRDNYEFVGWYTEAEGGSEITASTPFTYGTSQTTLYAHWEEEASEPSWHYIYDSTRSSMCADDCEYNCYSLFSATSWGCSTSSVDGSTPTGSGKYCHCYY